MMLVACCLPCSLPKPPLVPQWQPPRNILLVVVVMAETEAEEDRVTAAPKPPPPGRDGGMQHREAKKGRPLP